MSLAIVIRSPLPPSPLELVPGSFVEDLSRYGTEVLALKVTDQETAQRAVDLQRDLTKAGTALEKARADLKAPIIAAGKAIEAAAAGPAQQIETMKRVLKDRVSDWHAKETAKAAELERQRLAEVARVEQERQKELARLEKQRLEEEAVAAKKAEELRLAALPPPPDDLGLEDEPAPAPVPTATEQAIANLKHTPLPVSVPIVAPRPLGVTFRTTLRIKTVDVGKLPDAFVIKTANLVNLRSAFCSPWSDGQPIPECPGCVFEIDRQPVTR